jgi:hypothetical protein
MLASLTGRTLRAGLLAIALGSGLAGCAGIRGVQQQVTLDDLTRGVCPTPEELTAFSSSDATARGGLTSGAYRDKIIGQCIIAADRKFADFTGDLRTESTSVKLGVDLATLTLAGLGAVGNGAKDMAAATTGLIGAGAAVDKDVYFDKTLPALVSAMNVSRNEILAKIQKAQHDDPTGAAYSMANAAHDIWDYQNASNLDNAIKQLTNVVGQAEAQTAGVVQPLFTVGVVAAPLQAVRVKLTNYVNSLFVAGNRTQLNAIATALNLPKDVDPKVSDRTAAGDIRTEIVRRSQDQVHMAALQADLASLVPPEDFQ